MKAIKVNLQFKNGFNIACKILGFEFQELIKVKSDAFCYFRIKHFSQDELFQLGMKCVELVPED